MYRCLSQTLSFVFVSIVIEFSRITQSWHFCTTSNEKLEVITSGINFNVPLHLSDNVMML